MLNIRVDHLNRHPEHLPTVADRIYQEWWREKEGHSPESLARRLVQADDPDHIPLSLIALDGDTFVGTVNLVENDNDDFPELSPWLAALLVLPGYRGQGIGSQLVTTLKAEARRLGIDMFYLGTDIPDFYERFDAEIYTRARKDLLIMQMKTTE